MTIKSNAAVGIHYTLTDAEGAELDSSRGQDPLMYLHGANNIIPGLENALEGKTAGDSLTVTVEAAEAYGEAQEHLVQEVPRESFGDVEDIQEGMQFQAQTESGALPVVVTGVTETTVTVDGNHPLAGKTLTFDVSVDSVRDATEEELTHGHVHGPGGHQH